MACITVECDVCGDKLVTDHSSCERGAANREAVEKGWHIKNNLHCCPDCTIGYVNLPPDTIASAITDFERWIGEGYCTMDERNIETIRKVLESYHNENTN